MAASSPHRTQTEFTIKVMMEAELTIAIEDYAPDVANHDYVAQQINEQKREIRKHTDLKNVRMEGPC